MDVCSLTHVGNVRLENEDSVYVSGSAAPLLAMVADGMGGHSGGKTASESAVDMISKELENRLNKADTDDLKRAAINAGKSIFKAAQASESMKNMGTTIAAAVIREDGVCAVNAGDSRIYLLKDGELKRVTKDHKYVQYLVDKGFMTPEEAATHPYRNIITRALGMEEVVPDEFKISWSTGDTLLICSDGLYEEVSEDEIKRVLSSEKTAEQKSKTLLDMALEHGGRDNISIIVAINDDIIGMVIKNRFKVLELTAEGGMSRVYRAYDRKEKTNVAVKILNKEFSSNHQIVEGFLREGETTSRLTHRNIVRTIDYGVKNSHRYIIMNYIEGCTLADIMNSRRLTTDECVIISQKLISALNYAHHRGVIHRDLKPHNILIGTDGEPYITDFGIAEEVGENQKKDDQKVVGSVSYFSPEQATGGKTGPASDIYSMGIMLYEMCTGKLPFVSEDKLSVALMHLHTPPVPPKELNPELPESLNRIILKAIEKKPEMRYHSAAAMGRDVARALTDPSGAYVRTAFEHRQDRQHSSRRIIAILAATFTVIAMLSLGLISLVGQVQSSRTIFMPNLADRTEEDAIKMLKEYSVNLNIKINYEKGIEIEDGTVIAQSPEAGIALEDGDEVIVTVCKYTEEMPPMPDLTGMTEEQAKDTLLKMGISADNILCSQTNSYALENGEISSQYPLSGEQIDTQTQVILYVNRIFVYEQDVIPQMYGLDIEDALIGLNEYYSFKHIFVTAVYSPNEDYGTVYRQTPHAGDGWNLEQTMRLYIYEMAESNYKSSYRLPWAVTAAAKDDNEHRLTVAIKTQYEGMECLKTLIDRRMSYDEIRQMNLKYTDFEVFMPEMNDVGRSVLHFYIDGDELGMQPITLERINTMTEDGA